MFLRPDWDRIKEVGKQRACAEWLVRCGAHIRWEGSEKWERDYNSLPPDTDDNFAKLKIAEVNAVDASVMYDGFVYFGQLFFQYNKPNYYCIYLPKVLSFHNTFCKGNRNCCQVFK